MKPFCHPGLVPALSLLLSLLYFSHAAEAADGAPADPLAPALAAIRAPDLLKDIQVLSSDDFEGRSPGTHGEDLTVDYLISRFKALGLQPGNPDGSYVQKVPLTGHIAQPEAHVHVGGRSLDWRFPGDYVAWSYLRQPEVALKASELVFVGYGVKAPEYDWDDFKGVDLHGKTLVVLINDPQIPDPQHPDQLDEHLFKGRAMTYYGRWTYKYETAAALGAAAVLIVHETATAAYPWSVVVNSNSRENFDIHRDTGNPYFPAVPAWIHVDRARELFSAAGLDFDAMKRAALRRDFHPVPLHATLDLHLTETLRDIDSHNVVARIEGSDPQLRNETVIYSAHWDHFGWDPKLPGSKHEQVFHGAQDNASGTAALLAVAQAFKALPVAPRRSILFIATTAEERGLLGAQYYATHPLYPLRQTLADINFDGINVLGRTRDIQIIGFGNSDLDDRLVAAAATQGRSVGADGNSDKGSFFRADHFEFAKEGLPALYTRRGEQFIGQPAEFSGLKTDDYVSHRYHKVTDVVEPDWNLSGGVEDVQLLFRVGYEVAQGTHYPEWRADSEFKARRDQMIQGTPGR